MKGGIVMLLMGLSCCLIGMVNASHDFANDVHVMVDWVVYDVVVEFFRNWFAFIVSTFHENPGHFFTETLAILVIVYLLFQRRYDPSERQKLSRKEQDELIAEWKPEPLVQAISSRSQKRLANTRVVSGMNIKGRVMCQGTECLNFSSYNFLGISEEPSIQQVCAQTMRKYGVGSCGPRGFYGTIDVHMNLEERFAKWIGMDDAILYSDSIACVSSVIPCFSKKGDLIICDDGVNHNIISGVHLSRSNVLFFKHNDMVHLEQILDSIQERDLQKPFKNINRRFIIVEGLYQNKGDICPLDKVVELKFKHKFRLILDDSMGIGVLGESGKGTVEHYHLPPRSVDILSCALDTSIASVGGMCAGSVEVVDHQRLSGVGYVFSASSPPYTCTAAIEAIRIIEKDPSRCERLRQNSSSLRILLGQPKHYKIEGDEQSPLVLIHVQGSSLSVSQELELFEYVEDCLYQDHQILVGVSTYIPKESKPCRPSLRVLVTSAHSQQDLEELSSALQTVLKNAWNKFTVSK